MTKTNKPAALDLPWSHIISADLAGTDIEQLELTPTQAEEKALAEHLGVTSLSNLKVDLSFIREQAGLVIHVTGSFKADLVQECVVTLDPIPSNLEGEVEAWFADTEQTISFQKAKLQKDQQKQQGEMPILDEHDDPEAIIDGKLDLGDLVTQFLSLAIDSYPMKEDVKSSDNNVTKVQEASPTRKNPFEKLKEWKEKQES